MAETHAAPLDAPTRELLASVGIFLGKDGLPLPPPDAEPAPRADPQDEPESFADAFERLGFEVDSDRNVVTQPSPVPPPFSLQGPPSLEELAALLGLPVEALQSPTEPRVPAVIQTVPQTAAPPIATPADLDALLAEFGIASLGLTNGEPAVAPAPSAEPLSAAELFALLGIAPPATTEATFVPEPHAAIVAAIALVAASARCRN